MTDSIKKNECLRELTWRGFFLACILTVLFTAANVYLGLKVGLTFATSIPAAVISMAILRFFKDSNVLENNIVQTIASAAGTISATVFILPALVMVGFWQGFPFWQTFILCGIGGVLGVMFTIPLRRALVVESTLPFPEGTAAAKTLEAGSRKSTNKNAKAIGTPILDISLGTGLSFLFSLFSSGFQIFSDGFSYYGKIAGIYSGAGFQYSFALIGAGYLIGIRVAIALFVGTLISWAVAVPLMTSAAHATSSMSTSDLIMYIWTNKVRYIGAGVIGIAAIWAIFALLKPLYKGMKYSFASMQQRMLEGSHSVPVHERDIPIMWVLVTCIFLALPLMAVFGDFIANDAASSVYSAGFIISLVVVSLFLVFLIGFLVAAVSGYMAGLVGSSNSPISGIAIIAVIAVALVMTYIFKTMQPINHHINSHFIVGLVIFITAGILSVACISNDNLQDLQTGHLLGATPWKQQVALVFGVVVGAMVLAPILNQLYQAYGFVGAMPRPGMNPTEALNAPQATLMMAIAKGIVTGNMEWGMLYLGAGIGAVLLLINQFFLNKRNWQLSVLSIGIAIYLPPEINIPLILGGILSYIIKLKTDKNKDVAFYTEQCGTLFSSGFIVGSSLFGIILAIWIGFSSSQNPFSLVGANFKGTAEILGFISFTAICCYFVYYQLRAQHKIRKQL